ncbi:hypothetical protein BH18ACI3_BH18ACI3_10830 [soil metagenome]|jgi:catechol 2,3-dioxygenase-like lactoylglutathione lyase family enzyme
MKITELRPMFWTKDIESTVEYYVEVLGFRCREYRGDWGWASLSMDYVTIMTR